MTRFLDVRGRPPGLSQYFAPSEGSPQAAMVERVNRRVGSRNPRHFLDVGQSPAAYKAEIEGLGIERVLVFGKQHRSVFVDNADVADFIRTDSRYVGMGSVDPLHFGASGAVQEVRRINELGLRSVNIDSGLLTTPMLVNDRRLYPIYAECELLGLPVFLMSGPFSGPTLEHTRPTYYGEVARDFPDLRVVIGHGCYPYVAEAVALAVKYDNVWISPDIYTFMPGSAPYTEMMRSSLVSRLLFATGYPFRDMRQTVEEYLALHLPDTALAAVAWDNAASVLGFDDEGYKDGV